VNGYQFEIPDAIERQLRARRAEWTHRAREAFLVELYRDQAISHRQLGEALDLEPYETDGVLKRYNVGLAITPDEQQAEALSLRDVRP
jgi:hypothetical protein